MCGIYGIVHLDGRTADSTLLHRMARVLVHRGPDDEGCHVDGACAIGMRRLSIIDLAGGHQPLSNSSGTLWLVCNGEIYNFRELRAELQARGHVFRTGSDSEVLVHGYAEYGDAFVGRLNGMYAFALWDAARKRLLIGRDRLGIKPLYLCTTGRWLAFASEAKALVGLQGQVELDDGAVRSYLHLGYVPAPQSIFAGIAKMRPATLLVIQDGRIEERTYWRLPGEVDCATREEEWIERVSDRIKQAVTMQTVSDVPVGAFLSGGIDSSAVVAHIAANSSLPVRTYSIGFSGDAAGEYYNELPYARRVAKLFATDHHEIMVRPDVVALLPNLLWHMDEPVCDSAFITTYLVSQFARRDVTVILSGVGGDELFAGYRRYLGAHYYARFARLPGWMRRAARAAGERLPSDRHTPLLNMARLAKQFLVSAELPFEARYRSYVEVFTEPEIGKLLAHTAPVPNDPVTQAFAYATSDDDVNRMLIVDAQTQLPDDLLLLTDKMSMAVSLECRVPLLDHELVELAARIPGEIKMRGGRLKHVMKQALAPLLPRDILDRRKRGFGTPIGAWLKHELRPLIDHLLSKEAVERRGLFRYEPVRALVSAHEAMRTDATDKLLALLNLEIWSRLYLDTRGPRDVQAEMEEALA